METEHRQQLNVRVGSGTHKLLKQRAARDRVTVQAYVSGLIEREVDPERDTFVSGLVEDMTGLMKEFEDTFEAGRR